LDDISTSEAAHCNALWNYSEHVLDRDKTRLGRSSA